MIKIRMSTRLYKFLSFAIPMVVMMWGQVIVSQSPDGYRRGLLDVSNNGQIIAVSGRAIQDSTSQTGGRYPIDFYDSESGLIIGEFNGSAFGITGLAISPDGALLAYSNNDGRLAVVDVQTATEFEVIEAGGYFDIGYPRWSDDGGFLSSFSGNSIAIFETQGFTTVGGFYDDVSDGTVYGFDWSVNNQIAISIRDRNTDQGMIAIWDVVNPEESSLVNRIDAPLGLEIEWSPDAEEIATIAQGGILEITVDDESQRLFATVNVDDPVYSIAWSPDGQRIAGGGENIFIWNVQTAEIIETYSMGIPILSMEWSPDGQYLYHTGGPAGIYRDGIPLQDAIAQETSE